MFTILNLKQYLHRSPHPAPTTNPEQTASIVSTTAPAPFPFLSLPLDIRFIIYTYIFGFPSSKPLHQSPLAKFLRVNQQTRLEASSIFYRLSSGFVFSNPISCLGFLGIGGGVEVSRLSSLAVSVSDRETFKLEGVWRVLAEKGTGLRVLVLGLECKREFREWGKSAIDGVQMEVCGRGGESALDKARARASRLEVLFERSVRKGVPLNEFGDAKDSEREKEHVLRGPSYLGKLKSLRYVVVDGNPFGEWSVEFELALLALHEKLFWVAMEGEREGSGEVIPWFGRWGDWFWFGSRGFMVRRGFEERLRELNPALG